MSTHVSILKTKDNWAIYTATLSAADISGMTFIEDFILPFVIFGLKKVNGHGHIGNDGQPFVVYMPLKQFGLEIVDFVGFPEVKMTQPIPGLPVPAQEYPFVEANTFTELVVGPPADDDSDLD